MAGNFPGNMDPRSRIWSDSAVWFLSKFFIGIIKIISDVKLSNSTCSKAYIYNPRPFCPPAACQEYINYYKKGATKYSHVTYKSRNYSIAGGGGPLYYLINYWVERE